jgi:NADH:ubiquinone oxidoreductase subunit 6 (subunit J)
MTPVQIIFFLIALMTLGSALMVVTTKNLVHAALWLILSLFGIAVFFVLLSAGFLAIAQVVIYIGAIAILMIFAIMLTRHIAQDVGPQLNSGWVWAALVSAFLFGGLFWLLTKWPGLFTIAPELSPTADPLNQLGQALVSPGAYIIPFEVASILLVAALIGAIMVAWDRR